MECDFFPDRGEDEPEPDEHDPGWDEQAVVDYCRAMAVCHGDDIADQGHDDDGPHELCIASVGPEFGDREISEWEVTSIPLRKTITNTIGIFIAAVFFIFFLRFLYVYISSFSNIFHSLNQNFCLSMIQFFC